VTPHPGYLVFLFLTAIVAGAMNALAGGGSIITFPALLAAGVGPVAANATNAVATVPGSFSAGWAFRRELGLESRRVLITLVIASLVGGLLGAWLVVVAGDALFRALVPWLILGAVALFIVQEPLRRWRERRSEHATRSLDDINLLAVGAAQFVVAVYGGFFGAAMGILMLAELGLVGLTNIHQMNGLKNIAAGCINGIAAVYFAVGGQHVRWPLAILMAAGTVLGGYAGAWLAQRIGQAMVRWAIIALGLGIGVYMLFG